MHKRSKRIPVLAVLAALAAAVPPGARAQDAQPAMFRTLLPTVVNITALSQATPPPAAVAARAPALPGKVSTVVGSGFVIDPAGVIATNWHVVNGASEVTVTFSDGSRLPATLLSASRLMDTAVLKVEAGHPLPAARWGDSDQVQVGDPVVAIGNPLGIGTSVSSGIVSGLNRDIMETPYDDFIQTDAAINHGNSGGPLFNMRGEVIGIDSAIVSPTSGSAGLGFAIPAHQAQFVIDRLRRFGSLRPGWIGLKVQQVTPDMASALGMAEPQGSLVAAVAPDGPAAAAGVAVGDVVLRFNGAPIGDERALLRDVTETEAGQPITLAVRRGGAERFIPVTVADWPRSQWDALDAPVKAGPLRWAVPPDLGLTLSDLTDEQRARFGVAVGQAGVLVTGVAAGTDAAQRGLAPGDVVVQVGDAPVGTAAGLRGALDAARAGGRPFMLLLTLPKTEQRPGTKWVALRVSPG